jgi:hypothetical protein
MHPQENMDAFGFVASVVSSLAWPAAVVVFAILFRPQVTAILNRLPSRVKAGPVEVDWDTAAAAARVELASSPEIRGATGSGGPTGSSRVPGSTGPTGPSGPQARRLLSQRLAAEAGAAPAAAIIEAYAEVERVLELHLGADATGARAPGELVERARQAGIVSDQTAEAIGGLRTLRNIAAHGPGDEIGPTQATDFLMLADAVINAVEFSRSSPGSI